MCGERRGLVAASVKVSDSRARAWRYGLHPAHSLLLREREGGEMEGGRGRDREGDRERGGEMEEGRDREGETKRETERGGSIGWQFHKGSVGNHSF